MQTILFPTDFSDHANNALAYAVEVAKKINAKIDVIHIYTVGFNDVVPLPHNYVQDAIDAKKEQVSNLFKTHISKKDHKCIGKIKAIYGVFPAMEIMDYAEKEKHEYIIMGTRGRTNQIEKIIGSVTSSVIMKATCPVIAIPENAKFEEIYSIALAASFENKDNHSIDQLQDFAHKIEAGIHLVHVNTKSKKEEIQEMIQDEGYTVPFTQFTVVHNPSVVNGLDAFAKEYKIDMLALYIPNRKLWERIFHQSISRKMVLHAKIPLIAFH